jgi:carboxypeptidase Q
MPRLPRLLSASVLPWIAAGLAAQQRTVATLDDVAVLDAATVAAIRSEGLEHSQVMELLQGLTGNVGQRLTGSDNFTKACDWAVAEFQRMGLQNVHKEKWGEWNLIWNRGTWKGRVLEPVPFDCYVAAEAWTAGTNGPKKGRLVRAPKDADEVEANAKSYQGAWLWTPSSLLNSRSTDRQRLVRMCEDAGILGFAYLTFGDAKYPNRVRVFGDHLVAMRHIEDVPKVPRVAVQNDHAKQIQVLLDEGKEVVCEFQVDSEFKPGPVALNNVVAEIPGTEKPDEVVIVCGHLDSWHQAQGCTDNGTGTTSTMEAARILAKVGSKPKRTIRFILWGGEEEGLLGSVAYVKQHRTEMDKVSCVFNHDTGTNWAHGLSVTEKMYEPMQRVFAPIMQLPAPEGDYDGPVIVLRKAAQISGGGGSDHASFIAARVPGLDWGLAGRSDYFGYTWHSQWDKFDVAIPEYQRHTSTVIALAALGVADLPELLDHSGVVGGGRPQQSALFAGAMFGAEFDGTKFTKIDKDGNADKAGIKVGDVLQKVNGTAVEVIADVVASTRGVADDASLELELKRGDGTVKFRVKVGDLRYARDARQAATMFGGEFDGLRLTRVEKDGRADKVGFQAGDTIHLVDGTAVATLAELVAKVGEASADDTLEFAVRRGQQTVTIKVKAGELRSFGGRRGRGGGSGPGEPGPGNGRQGARGGETPSGPGGNSGGGGNSSGGSNGGGGEVRDGDTGEFRWGIVIDTGVTSRAAPRPAGRAPART